MLFFFMNKEKLLKFALEKKMIVEERSGDHVNIYVDNYVFSADIEKRVWEFGDGQDSEERRKTEASKRGITIDEFTSRYRSICNAAAGWDDPEWTYRYNVVALDGQGTMLLKEVMDRVEEAIERNGVAQNREKCQEMLKRYASLGVIRQSGLSVKKYIYDKKENGQGRIVYRMEELTHSWIESLIPESVLSSAVYRKK